MSVAAPPIFDSHCHLGQFQDGDPVAEHARAAAAGVVRLLVVGIDAKTSAQAESLAPLTGVGWSAGLHPNDALRLGDEWPAIEALARRPGCLAIGETGLDTFRDRCPVPQQERSLRTHLALARELDLPVILHCRDAYAPLYTVLRELPPHRGVMHCFSGTLDDARTALDLGLLLSFAGPLTYPKNDALRQVAAFAPADRILVETDAPFLPPQGHRGKRNEPALIVATVQALAQTRHMPFAAAAELTFANASRLFDRAGR
ncbi:MAG: TatD family hydrolase [Planctomycetes bacterium]|nr:TatD family hydrolase [Planctomycetota bacterium]